MSEDAEYFPGPKELVPQGTLLDTRPNAVDDVVAAFDCLRARPERLGSWDMDRFPHPAYLFQNVGNGETRTHFQGIQRLAKHDLLVVSGGDRRHGVSHLFLVECAPRTAWGPLGSNLWKDRRSPPNSDRLRRIIALDRDRWHAGGISVLGDIVAVPLEGQAPAQVVFLDLSTPNSPRWVRALDSNAPATITCETKAAGAVALTRTPDGHFMCAVWRDENPDRGEKAGRLDFFVSENVVPESERMTTFEPDWRPLGTWGYSSPNSEMPEKPHYQGISFVWERATRSLYLIGTRNSSLLAPNAVGEDWADLYRVTPPARMALSNPGTTTTQPEVPTLVYVGSKRVRGTDEFCSFAGGGGAFVSEAGALMLYGAFHFRGDGLFRMSEFWSHCCPAADWWVELYERSHFEGHRLAIFGADESRIDVFDERFAQGDKFDETVVSVRFRLPVGTKYRLYRESRCPELPKAGEFVDLVGTGSIVEIAGLASLSVDFGRSVRSAAICP